MLKIIINFFLLDKNNDNSKIYKHLSEELVLQRQKNTTSKIITCGDGGVVLEIIFNRFKIILLVFSWKVRFSRDRATHVAPMESESAKRK